MRFQVPQFIETETKIVGPFTLKQFLWIAGGVAIIFLMFLILPLPAFIVATIPIGVVFASLAFVKIDNVPLFNYFVYSVAYLINPRRYFFKKAESSINVSDTQNIMPPKMPETIAKAPENTHETPTENNDNNKKPLKERGYIEQERIIR